jgi:hypothetical protein
VHPHNKQFLLWLQCTLCLVFATVFRDIPFFRAAPTWWKILQGQGGCRGEGWPCRPTACYLLVLSVHFGPYTPNRT